MDSIEQLFADAGNTATQIGATYQRVTNDLAALEAQNRDIAGGRWTLNNAVYQFNQLTPLAQLAVMAALAYAVSTLIKKG